MPTIFKHVPLSLALTAVFNTAAQAQTLEEPLYVVVTAPASRTPLSVSFDPKAPAQPLPANDGASLLKTIPGMNVSRKGGTDGDPVFRGMAGSRLNILLDGEHILGGCGNRMDPPTAYVFPETYDRVTLLKGPQTVRYGPGNSAGTVLFERETPAIEQAEVRFNGSLTGGSFGRHDELGQVVFGNPQAYLRASASNAQAEDYRDGDGQKVHSRYQRWSNQATMGWTPDSKTRFEISASRSDGKAAYADRTVDGSKFARENYGLRFEKRDISETVEKLELQAYYNYVDHVMDNYSLRQNPTGMNWSAMNPDRETVGGRLAATLRPISSLKLTLGSDLQDNRHTNRNVMMGTQAQATNYGNLPRTADAEFSQHGLFAEAAYTLDSNHRLFAGLRSDFWQATDQRATVRSGMASQANPTAGMKRDETLTSGFARIESLLGKNTLYAGIGHVERFPDYWELIGGGKETLTSSSAFNIRPEKVNQLDVGTLYRQGPLSVSLSGFYNRTDDFILIQSSVIKGMSSYTVSRNIDVRSWGGEIGADFAFTPEWKANANLAYVRADNLSDHTPLGQTPPLEARFGLTWDNRVWSVGGLWRLVAAQDRFTVNQGNIVGQDLGRSSGFGVFSLNGAYRAKKGITLSTGVDNLFDKTYAEHISRTGTPLNMMGMASAVPGYATSFRVNEPGRNIWIKLQIALD